VIWTTSSFNSPASRSSAIAHPHDREWRVLFDTVAELYDRARPTYPDAVFDDLVALTGIPAGGRVLEIGCGTGQATRAMAERGYDIVAVELGANLAGIAQRNLAGFENVRVETSSFEEWPLPSRRFDLVMAVHSFHWLDAKTALPKVADALATSGAFAMIGGGHTAGGDEQFFIDVQECYEKHMPGTPPGLRLSRPEDTPYDTDDIEASALFEPPDVRRHVWLRHFTTQTYIDEINTYSNHIALPPPDRAALLECIASLIHGRYGDRITKAYLTDLVVARKRA
jgi:SAM-dependent methyltransferase